MGSRLSVKSHLAEEAAEFGLKVGTTLLGACSAALVTFGVYCWLTIPGASILHATLLCIGVTLAVLVLLASFCLPRESRRFLTVYIVVLRLLGVATLVLGLLFSILSAHVISWSAVALEHQPLAASVTQKSGFFLVGVSLLMAGTYLVANRVFRDLFKGEYAAVRTSAEKPSYRSKSRQEVSQETAKRSIRYGALDDIYSGSAAYRYGDVESGEKHLPPVSEDYTLDNSLFDSRSRTDSAEEESAIRSKYAQLYEKYSLA